MRGITVRIPRGGRAEGRYESRLYFPGQPSTRIENGIIQIDQRIQFIPYMGSTFERRDKTYRCARWDRREWNNFRFLFLHIVRHWWNEVYRVWLQPFGPFDTLDVPFIRPTHRPNYKTAYNVIKAGATGPPPDVRILGVRLADGEDRFRSSVSGDRSRAVLSNRDVRAEHRGRLPHITALHESSHMVGVEHPGGFCR